MATIYHKIARETFDPEKNYFKKEFVEVSRQETEYEVELNTKIAELEKENAELRQANEILKDALGFFAKDRKK